jgi:hypothetical protein
VFVIEMEEVRGDFGGLCRETDRVTESGREGAGVLSVRESVSVLDGWLDWTDQICRQGPGQA